MKTLTHLKEGIKELFLVYKRMNTTYLVFLLSFFLQSCGAGLIVAGQAKRKHSGFRHLFTKKEKKHDQAKLEKVQILKDESSRCRSLGIVSYEPVNSSTYLEKDGINYLKEKVYNLGGNSLIIEEKKPHRIRGNAYKCNKNNI